MGQQICFSLAWGGGGGGGREWLYFGCIRGLFLLQHTRLFFLKAREYRRCRPPPPPPPPPILCFESLACTVKPQNGGPSDQKKVQRPPQNHVVSSAKVRLRQSFLHVDMMYTINILLFCRCLFLLSLLAEEPVP